VTKSIEEYTDKELEKSIKLHETEIEKDRKTKYPNKDLRNGIERKEEFLKKLYEERDRRKKSKKKMK
jgi:hypothetical protein